MRNSYTVVIHGVQLTPRTSDREYSHCIVADIPKAPPRYADLGASWMTAQYQLQVHARLAGQVMIVSCHADYQSAVRALERCHDGRTRTPSVWQTYIAGAVYSLHRLTKLPPVTSSRRRMRQRVRTRA
jgi:hypothetical protein